MSRIVCVKLKDDIHNPGELNGQMMALKDHIDDKMTSSLFKWVRTGVKEKRDLEEDSYKF